MRTGIIIPTLHERPVLLDFVLKRMDRQTKRADIRLLIDYPNTKFFPDVSRRYKEGIKELLDQGCEFILFIEDDDYYPYTYVEEMFEVWNAVGRPPLIGNKTTIYYHLPERRYQTIRSISSAAFACGVSPGVKYDVCGDNEACYDAFLWRNNQGRQVELHNPPIGIKHGLGRCGTPWHRGGGQYRQSDPELLFLRQNMDTEAYNFYRTL